MGETTVTFSQWIKEKRESLHLKGYECAERAGMKPQTWSRWEAGENRSKTGTTSTPRPDTLRAIAKGLGVDVAEVAAAAGITDGPQTDINFARRLDSIIRRVPADRRHKAQDALVQVAEALVLATN